ncbi:MAG: response regulator transcription factor [Gammaproteobacteria bacterium]|nr:response regulator transcription factor [Gammaproteobacteria bacterium]
MDTALFHIALVEDEAAQRVLLVAYLEREGFRVSPLESARACEALLEDEPPDLLLLDLNLPDGDGMELARRLRRHSSLPIIMLTCRDTDADRIAGLELGADDYLAKPCHPRELVARVRNLLKRSIPPDEAVGGGCRVGRFLLDPVRGRFSCDDGAAPRLTPGEFALLCALAGAKGRAVSRWRLAEVIRRGEEPSSERTVDVLVSRLRRKIEANPANPALLLTVPGHGYRLAC